MCDLDGEKLVVRDDDSEPVIRERLDAYERQTRPVLEFFRRRPGAWMEVDAERRFAGAVFEKICGSALETDDYSKDRRGTGEDAAQRPTGLADPAELEKMAWRAPPPGIWKWPPAKMIADAGAKPAFKGYYVPAAGEHTGLCCAPRSITRSSTACRIAKRILKKGDIVSIDTGVKLDGYYGDSAITVAIGEIGEQTRKLLRVTEESLELAIDQVRAGNRLFDICGTVEQHVKANGFSVVREYVGHGIGTQLHEEPQVPNYVDRKNENPRLKEGMVLAVEPMVNAGRPEAVVLKDKWTAVTKDGSTAPISSIAWR